MNTSHNFIFKSAEKVILGKKMSLAENIVSCNLELPHQHTLEGDKLYCLFSPTMAARLTFYTFADEPLSGCHKRPSVHHTGWREGTASAESGAVEYSNNISHCFKQKKDVVDKGIYLTLF